MRVLFLTQVLPYPQFGGAKIRAYYMLRQLAQTHQVTLVSFVREDDRREYVEHLQQFCEAVHTVPMQRSRLRDGLALLQSVGQGKPAVICRDRIGEMHELLRQLVGETAFDVVHADQTSMAAYGLSAAEAVEATGGPEGRPRIVLDQHNAMHLLLARQAERETGLGKLLYRREANLFRRYEATLCRCFDRVMTVTEEDKAAHLALFTRQEGEQIAEKMTAIPICVDAENEPPLAYEDEGAHIIHLGTMFWPPNVEGVMWFAEEVLPLVLAEVPEAQFTIAGKNPPAQVEALAEPGSPVAGHVEVTGFVADPEPLLRRSRAFIVPVRAGGGMRVKILDGWRWGIPMVSTTVGAEGIAVRNGGSGEANILLADEAPAFAEAVVQLLVDKALGDSLRRNGREWVKAQYDWRTIYRQVDALYEGLSSLATDSRLKEC